MKSNMTVRVEFLAGTSIEGAVQEAIQKAKLWDVAYVSFKFNGVNMNIRSNTNPDEAVEKFQLEICKSADEHKFVCC